MHNGHLKIPSIYKMTTWTNNKEICHISVVKINDSYVVLVAVLLLILLVVMLLTTVVLLVLLVSQVEMLLWPQSCCYD